MIKRFDIHKVTDSDFEVAGSWDAVMLLAFLKEQEEYANGVPVDCTQVELAEVTRIPYWKVHAILKELHAKGVLVVSVENGRQGKRSRILVIKKQDEKPAKKPKGQLLIADEFLTEEEKWEKEMYVAFEDCWHIYPRKVGKHYAFESFKREVKKGADPKLIFRMLQQAQDRWKGTKVHFIPHLSTWLNQGRYNDYGNYAPIYKGQDKEDEFQGF